MIDVLIKLWKPVLAIREAGLFDVSIVGIMVAFYFLKYIPDQKTIKDEIGNHNCRANDIVNSLNKLSVDVQDINLAMVREHISKAEIPKEIWELVRSRLNETADITFTNAIINACPICSDECLYFAEFSKSAQARRKESFHIWEAQTIPRSILTIIEQIDTELYPHVTEQYIPDITSICKNKEYKKLPKDIRLELIKSKVEAIKEKVKSDWERAIMRRISLI